MPRIIIQNLGNFIIDTESTDGKVIELIHENGIDWMHACGKKGRCTTCKMVIVQKHAELTEPTDAELTYRKLNRLGSKERLTCQTRILSGEILIRVAEINKFPHVKYTE